MTIRAETIREVELSDPYYVGWEVYFGLMPSGMGTLSPLSHAIIIHRWLIENPTKTLVAVEGHRVIFEKEDDAQRCYEGFR